MKQSVSIIFYDGVISKPHHAQLSAIDSNTVVVVYDDHGIKKQRFKTEQMTLIGALARKYPVIELDHDERIEFLSHDIPEWLSIPNKKLQQRIWALERTPSLIIFSVIFVIALGISVLKWGIPYASKTVAFQLPENTLKRLGDQAQSYVLNMTEPSQLASGQQQLIRAQYLNKIAQGHPAKIIFRQGEKLGANALALPNNTIIITDELVGLTHSDQEILGVLAHEQGHLMQRHSLQQGLSSLGFSVLYIAMTGDSSDLLMALPVAVLGAGYSRKFEKEADLFALHVMHKQNIEVSHFANFLQRLNDETTETEEVEKQANQKENHSDSEQQKLNIFDALSSHPATEERIQMVRDFEKNINNLKAD